MSVVEEQSNNLSAADEIDLNSDSEFKDDVADAKAKHELRSEPEDIFEDIPETKEIKIDATPVRPILETSVTSPRTQVCLKIYCITKCKNHLFKNIYVEL